MARSIEPPAIPTVPEGAPSSRLASFPAGILGSASARILGSALGCACMLWAANAGADVARTREVHRTFKAPKAVHLENLAGEVALGKAKGADIRTLS